MGDDELAPPNLDRLAIKHFFGVRDGSGVSRKFEVFRRRADVIGPRVSVETILRHDNTPLKAGALESLLVTMPSIRGR